eukprot:c29379_g2_i2 orf=335-835(-)
MYSIVFSEVLPPMCCTSSTYFRTTEMTQESSKQIALQVPECSCPCLSASCSRTQLIPPNVLRAPTAHWCSLLSSSPAGIGTARASGRACATAKRTQNAFVGYNRSAFSRLRTKWKTAQRSADSLNRSQLALMQWIHKQKATPNLCRWLQRFSAIGTTQRTFLKTLV